MTPLTCTVPGPIPPTPHRLAPIDTETTPENHPPDLAPGAGAPLVGGPASSILPPGERPALGYLGSPRNVAGAVGAVIGIVIAFTGIVGGFWPLLVIGLYGAGALLGPAVRRTPRLAAGHGGADDVRAALTAQSRAMSGRLPADVMARVTAIHNEILGLLPRVEGMSASSENLYIVRATALEYLPAALQAYVELPPSYATSETVADGRTPRAVLLEQLTLLETKMQEVAHDVAHNNTDRLLANGRFLQEKFGSPSDLRLPPGQ